MASKTITVWLNPQDGYLETGEAPEWAKTFEVSQEELHKANQINSYKIELDSRMGF